MLERYGKPTGAVGVLVAILVEDLIGVIEVEVEAEAVVVVVKREVEAVSVVVEGEEAKVAVVEGEVKQVEAGLEEQSVQDHISFVLYSISVNCLAYPCTASTISTFILTLMFHIFICELCVLATNYSVVFTSQ